MNDSLIRLIATIGPEHLFRFWVSAQDDRANHVRASGKLTVQVNTIHYSVRQVQQRLRVQLYATERRPIEFRGSTSIRRTLVWSPQAIALRDALTPVFAGLAPALGSWEKDRLDAAA